MRALFPHCRLPGVGLYAEQSIPMDMREAHHRALVDRGRGLVEPVENFRIVLTDDPRFRFITPV